MENKDIVIESNVENLELYSDNYPFRLSLRVSNFENEAAYKKFINNCESMIRKSIEYKLWRNYIVDILQVNECAVTHENMEDVTVEIHHHPVSMYATVSAIINKHIDENTEFCTYDICTEVIEMHFKNKVGYVALLKSMHEKFHNGKLTIPIGLVRGDYNYFLTNYSKYLEESEIDKIQQRIGVNESNCNWSRDNYQVAAEA